MKSSSAGAAFTRGSVLFSAVSKVTYISLNDKEFS
jgi:hypothetical protein